MFFKLFKIFWKENFSLKRFLGFDPKSNRLKTFFILLAIAYALVVFLGGFIYLTYDLAKILASLDAINLLINFIFFYTIALVTLIVLFRMNGLVFYSKDYEMFAHYPIHYRTLFISKFMILVVMVYLGISILTLPMVGYYLYYASLSFGQLIMFILGILLFPIIPIVVFSFMALFLALATRRFRKSQLMNTILMIILFLGFSVFLMSYSQLEVGNPLLGQQLFMQEIENVYPLLKWFIQSIEEVNVFLFLAYFSINILVMALYIYYIPILAHITNQSTKKTLKRLSSTLIMKKRSFMHTMVLKEWKKMINSPIYALNAGLGSLMLILLPTASIFFKSEVLNLFEMIPEGKDFLKLSILALVGFSISMSYSPSVSLSLEGKNFWLLKSSPISPLMIVLSKVLFNIVLILIPGTIGFIIFAFIFELETIFILVSYLLMIAYALFSSLFSALLNLYFPKFDFINEVEVVKQSVAALISVFSGFIFLGLAGMFLISLEDYLILEIRLLGLIIIVTFITLGLWWYVRRHVDKIFERLSA
ncbi:MAG: hypothetical protein ACLFRI_05110 [Candidatus Izemoplasmataceae bacterium]